MSEIDVSVIIVNFNTSDMLRECLSSVYALTTGIQIEIIVVDNASSDDSAEMVQKLFPFVILIQSETNIGFGKANNLGSVKAKGKYFFFLNSDTKLQNNALYELAFFMDSHEKVAICGGNLTDFQGQPIHSYETRLPSPLDELRRFLPASLRRMRIKNEYNFTNTPKKVGYITGADLMIRSLVFKNLRGFNPTFFMYYEETELSYRVKKDGHEIYSVPSAHIYHFKGASLTQLESVKSIVYESKYMFMQIVYGFIGAYMTHVIFRIYCTLKIVFNTVYGKSDKSHAYSLMKKIDKSAFIKKVIKENAKNNT